MPNDNGFFTPCQKQAKSTWCFGWQGRKLNHEMKLGRETGGDRRGGGGGELADFGTGSIMQSWGEQRP